MAAVRENGATRAASALLVDRAHLLLPLAAQLGDAPRDFESAIRGSSMAPAIPAAARLRVRCGGRPPCRVGDVVIYLADGGYTVHRIVYRGHGPAGEGYLLAEGDARFAADPPVPCGQVLGTVVAVQIDGRWQPIGPRPASAWHRRAVRAVTLAAMIVTTWCSAAAATWLAGALLALETRVRMGRRRVLAGRPSAPGPSASAGRGEGAG
jgi:hypothetical protein